MKAVNQLQWTHLVWNKRKFFFFFLETEIEADKMKIFKWNSNKNLLS